MFIIFLILYGLFLKVQWPVQLEIFTSSSNLKNGHYASLITPISPAHNTVQSYGVNVQTKIGNAAFLNSIEKPQGIPFDCKKIRMDIKSFIKNKIESLGDHPKVSIILAHDKDGNPNHAS